jgi:hypothetical protein
MTTKEVADQRDPVPGRRNLEAIDTLLSADVVSVEAPATKACPRRWAGAPRSAAEPVVEDNPGHSAEVEPLPERRPLHVSTTSW